MILQFERWNRVLPTPVPRGKNSGPRMRNRYGVEGMRRAVVRRNWFELPMQPQDCRGSRGRDRLAGLFFGPHSSEILVLGVVSSIRVLRPLVFTFWSRKGTRVNGVLGLCKFWRGWLPLLILCLLRSLCFDLFFRRALPFSFLKPRLLLFWLWSVGIRGLFG